MDIIVKGRHTGVPQRFRDYANEKLAKIQKFDPKVISIDVEVSRERNPRLSDRRERVELTCHSKGPAIRAEAAADDRYVALDHALSRLKERLRKVNDRRKVHRGSHTPRSVAEATAPGAPRGNDAIPATNAAVANPGVGTETAGDSPEHAGHQESPVHLDYADDSDDPDQATVPLETDGDAPVVVREKIHRAKPMTLDQALFEMELVGHDFFLFRDRDSGEPSVAYRRHAFDYGVIRLEE